MLNYFKYFRFCGGSHKNNYQVGIFCLVVLNTNMNHLMRRRIELIVNNIMLIEKHFKDLLAINLLQWNLCSVSSLSISQSSFIYHNSFAA